MEWNKWVRLQVVWKLPLEFIPPPSLHFNEIHISKAQALSDNSPDKSYNEDLSIVSEPLYKQGFLVITINRISGYTVLSVISIRPSESSA